jgi:hypothetical protein
MWLSLCRLDGIYIPFSHATCRYQQNRVPHLHRKNHLPRQYYGPRPITAGPGLTLLKTKAQGQVLEPPNAPPLCPTPVTSSKHPSPVTSSRRSTPLHIYCFAQPPPTVTHCHEYAQAPTLSCQGTGARRVAQDCLETCNT